MIFSGRKLAPSELEEMKAHAKTCEACRVLLQNADVLASARSLDAQIEVPASFTQGWRARVRQMPRRQSVLQRVAAYLSGNGGQRVMRLAAAACCAVALFGAGVRMGEGNRLNAADAASVAQDEAPMLYSAEMMPQVASRSRMADTGRGKPRSGCGALCAAVAGGRRRTGCGIRQAEKIKFGKCGKKSARCFVS